MFPENYIVCAAVKTEDGIVHTGKRHSDCFALIGALGKYGTHQQSVQGFVDNKWVFKTRSEAFKIAKKSGQLLEKRNGESGILYSEGIY